VRHFIVLTLGKITKENNRASPCWRTWNIAHC